MKLHPAITEDRICDAIKRHNFGLDDPGFCIACGEETGGVEPDARNYPCPQCERRAVFGAEEILFMTGWGA